MHIASLEQSQGSPGLRGSSSTAAVTAALLCLTGCAQEPAPPATTAAAAPTTSTISIPHPPLDEMEPAVTRVLEAQRSKLDAMLLRDDVSTAEWGQALGRMGQLYQAHRLVEAAEACYFEAHTLDPERFDWAYYLGVLATRRGNLEAAAAAFHDAIELRPRDLPAMIRLADLELDRGKIAPAQALYEEILALDPSIAAAAYGIGRIAAERRNYRSAIEHFDQALTLQPQASVIHYHLGQSYRQLRELDQATFHLEQSGPVKVAIMDPLMSAVDALATGASPYLLQGNTALRDGRLSVAAKAFRLAVEADPDHPKARQSLATVLTLLRDPKGAIEQLEAAAKLAPDNAQAQSDLGTALAEQGQEEPALRHLRRAVELEPGLQQAQFNLANTLARLGRLGEAEGHYRHLLEIDPNHLMARSRLGTALAQAGKLEQAIPELRRVVQQDPEDIQTHLNLARVHFNLATSHLQANDHRQALEHFRHALDHDDRLAPAHLNAGKLLATDGRLTEALPHFARARELEPHHLAAWLDEATALLVLMRFSEAKVVLEDAEKQLPDEKALTHALARLLAGVPDSALRDGQRALALMARLLKTATVPSYVETQAMALAELGRFQDATGQQRAVLAEVRRRGLTADAERVARNLARYEGGITCCADPRDVLP